VTRTKAFIKVKEIIGSIVIPQLIFGVLLLALLFITDPLYGETFQSGYAWSDDVASFTSKGNNRALNFTTDTTYILGIQVAMQSSLARGDWVLQVREDGGGNWLNVFDLGVGNSPVWQTYSTHTFIKVNNQKVFTSEFGNSTAPAGYSAVRGRFSDDNNGLTDRYRGTNIYTELQYAVRATSAGTGHSYEFRVLYNGALLNGGYDFYAQAIPVSPDVILLKSVVTFSDPVNNKTNPKAIPGAVMFYTVAASNQGVGATDADTVFITDPIPANTALFVGNIDGTGPATGPVLFTDGTPPDDSGLSYTFITLDSGADDVAFSSDGGATYTYEPVPDGNGFDTNVTHLRINPKGSFKAASGGNIPTFDVKFKVRVD